MALTLKLGEMLLFEEKAGTTWAKAKGSFFRTDCTLHRLEHASCLDCLSLDAGTMCPAHLEKYRTCTLGCSPGDPTAKVLAATGWLLKRREDRTLTWDEYIESAEPEDAWAAVGNANREEPEAAG